MGSSPVTATTPSAASTLLSTLDAFFSDTFPLPQPAKLLVAFSGGPDSLALLWGLTRLSERRSLSVLTAHLDHGMDSQSAERRIGAEQLARKLGVHVISDRREVPKDRLPGEGLEAAARRLRYEFLEEARRESGAVVVATAHHREDQAETVLLRLRSGSGWRGLAGIHPILGQLVRPVLTLPRSLLREVLNEAELQPLDDPTNQLLLADRNRLRLRWMPALTREDPDLVAKLCRISERTRILLPGVDERLSSLLQPRRDDEGIAVSRRALARLPSALMGTALAALHRWAGAPYPASEAAAAELARQLASGAVGCDCGQGHRWESFGQHELRLVRPRAAVARPFSYTFRVPGEADLPELGLSLRLRMGSTEGWMFKAWPQRTGLRLPIRPGEHVEVRSRLPGDRLRPFGHGSLVRLKSLLIDHKVARQERDRLPLLVVEGNIAWVPGVTVDDRYRVEAGESAWIAELLPLSRRQPEMGSEPHGI